MRPILPSTPAAAFPAAILIAGAVLLMLCCHPAVAAADAHGLDLPAACASVHVATLNSLASPETGFDATRLQVRLPEPARGASPSMTAAELRVASGSAATSLMALERAASASAAALLIGLAGSGHSGCRGGLLQDAGRPIADGLRHGGAYVADWRGVTLRGASGHVSIRRMELRLTSQAGGDADRPVRVAFTLDGITGSLTPPTLLPDHLALRLTLPAASLPTLLAATGGGAPDARIPLTIDSLRVTEGSTALQGAGVAIAAATPDESSATLHLTAHDFRDLVTRASVLGLVRLHTALFVANLMGRSTADGLQWDVTYQDGLLAVNKLPIPFK